MEQDDIGLSPLPEGHPDWAAGRDSDPNFEALSAEIARMSSMTESASAPPDWPLVVKNGVAILSEKAKDVQVASYSAVGMLHTDGVTGLSRGIKILGDIFHTHSETAFPPKKRKRARINAVDWWLERTTAWLGETDLKEIPHEFSQTLNERVRALDDALVENFGDESPLLSDLKAYIQRIPVAPPPAAEPEETSVEEVAGESVETTAAPLPAQAAPSTPSASPSASGAPRDADEARRTIARLLAEAAQAGDVLGAEANADPLPYRLRRLAAWSGIRTAPPAEDGKTMLPAPEAHVIHGLNSLFESGDFAGALRFAEEQVGVYLFWLDPHRVAAQALAAMGQTHQSALNAVKAETSLFTARIPSLSRLAFTDGTPFADAKTKSWLSGLSESGGEGGGSAENPEFEKALASARAAAGTNPEEGLRLLSEAVHVAGHPRERLLLRVEILKTFEAGGHPDAARAQIPGIVEILDQYGLDAWEPALASRALAAAVSVLTGEGESDALRRRLAVCAPAQYLKL